VETTVGVVDVKSSPVYFHVQRNSSYYTTGTIIPFHIARLNVGGGMNITSGIFTAPKSGIYFFSFSAVKEDPATAGMYVDLYLNSTNIARGFGQGALGHYTASLSSTLSLKSGDRISLLLTLGQLWDTTACHTNFNGILLQEEI
jgi:C1q-related factor